ncbi:MAG TPA: type II CAAX endopeptidase family protein [Planctomycetota bacterium]|nr:type II CAAX endopeptidase family protein [Planctomycetota bacterium]
MTEIQPLPGKRIDGRRRRALIALLLLVPVPSLGIACEMIWFPGTLGFSVLGATKIWIFGLPWFWTALVERRPIVVDRPTSRGLGIGWLTGIVGAIGVVVIFQLLLRQRIDPAVVREMVSRNHLLSPGAYGLVAVYSCVFNSLLEEYLWRWFVLGKLEELMPRRLAVFASAAAFTLHHTLILATQFNTEIAVIGSIAVFAAGVTWSAIYSRTRSIWSAWLSHALIDVAVFWAGWQLLFTP